MVSRPSPNQGADAAHNRSELVNLRFMTIGFRHGVSLHLCATHPQLPVTLAGIEEGAIFRRLIGQNRVGERLHADIIADIYKRVARWVGMPTKQVDQVSGHSVRVGATQDPLSLNIDLASIMQSGRWKSSRMPMRYGEEVLAARGGMARAAREQGRDSQAEP
jgi:hypothetical protein